jgi:hypothetical protein
MRVSVLCEADIGEFYSTLYRWETNLTTKIITLLEFFNFVSEVSRLQYEWSSVCWCIWKSLAVNACLQWRNVFSFHWRSVFVPFFLQIFRGYHWLHMRVSWSISKRRDRYEHLLRALLSLPGNSRTIVSLRIPSCILSRAGVRLCGTQTFQSPSVVGQWNQAKASGLVVFKRENSSKVTFSLVVNMPAL